MRARALVDEAAEMRPQPRENLVDPANEPVEMQQPRSLPEESCRRYMFQKGHAGVAEHQATAVGKDELPRAVEIGLRNHVHEGLRVGMVVG